MRLKLFIVCTILFFHTFCCAQENLPTNSFLLGYQKFPTTITGHTSDSSGNQYFFGTFKGELTINGNYIASGNGLEDLFWVKTNADGQLLNYKVFGSTGTDQSFYDGMVMGENNHMLCAARIIEQVTFGSITVSPYVSSVGAYVTGCMVYTDTSGTVKWVKRTNLQNFRLFYADNIFHVIGTTPSGNPAVKIEDAVVMDSTGLPSVVDLMFDKSGKLLNTKIISSRKKEQGVNLFFMHSFSDKKLLLGISCTGDSSFYINNQPVSLPSRFSGYTLLVKTDTSYLNLKTKLLNPLGYSVYFNGVPAPPITTSPNDSIYTIITYESFSPFSSLDGFTQPPQRNVLYVLDSSLTAKRQVILGSTFAGNYPSAPQRRKLFFWNIAFKNNQLFFSGQFSGINESPMNVIPVKDTTLTVLPNVKLNVDQNGPSKSFIAKCDLNGLNGMAKWYMDHHEYEYIFAPQTFFHRSITNRSVFVCQRDNVWNPWIIDDTLKIVTGSMRKNADLPEASQLIRYFDDGSRIVLGYARGKTALDSAGDFITNAGRQDLFLARLRANNQVVWYKRFHSTLLNADARKLEIKDGKAWFLINYVGTQNDSNYIRIGTNVFDVKVNASVLASVDTAGNLTVLNFADPRIRYAYFTSFDFFNNGDIAVLSNTSFISLPNFPPGVGNGAFLFRLKPSSGSVLDIRRIYGSSGIDNIVVDNNNQIYISGAVSSTPYNIYLHDGTKYIDSLSINATSPGLGFLKLEWNRLRWQKRFSIAFLSKAEVLLQNNKPVLFSPAFANQALAWDGQPIHNGFQSMSLAIVMLDTNGVMIRNKVLPSYFYNYARSGSSGQLLVSGNINQSIKIDTIQVNYSGNGDGLGLVIDSNLVAKKSFRLASPYSEGLLDLDIFRDSLVAVAYVAQTNPDVYTNRLMVKTGDYEEDGYVATFISRTNLVTAVNNPLPPFNELTVAPNPVVGFDLKISATVTQSLPSNFMIYQSNGQIVTNRIIYLTPGAKQYTITLPHSITKGVYYVVVNNKKWTSTRSFIIQ